MPDYRLYIDESGDHTYRRQETLATRYLGLTGVLIEQDYYAGFLPDRIRTLKQNHFRYDPDQPPILVRQDIMNRRGAFGVLREPARNQAWEDELLDFFQNELRAQIFTVVIDKQTHRESYGDHSWNPYTYSLEVLLWRVRGYLNAIGGWTADVMPESRGNVEDNQLLAAYVNLRVNGAYKYGTARAYRSVFPSEALLFRRKDQDIAGLQIADLVAADQKKLTVYENRRGDDQLLLSPFGVRLNQAIQPIVNRYGRYLLA